MFINHVFSKEEFFYHQFNTTIQKSNYKYMHQSVHSFHYMNYQWHIICRIFLNFEKYHQINQDIEQKSHFSKYNNYLCNHICPNIKSIFLVTTEQFSRKLKMNYNLHIFCKFLYFENCNNISLSIIIYFPLIWFYLEHLKILTI